MHLGGKQTRAEGDGLPWGREEEHIEDKGKGEGE